MSKISKSSVLPAVLICILSTGLACAGTFPQVGSDNQIPNGDFAPPSLEQWSIETVGTASVIRLQSPGVPIDGTGFVTLFTDGAGSVARLVSDCIPLNDPGPGFQYLLTARYRVATGSSTDSSIKIDRFSDLTCTQPIGSVAISAALFLGDPTSGGWSLFRSVANSSAIRITLTQISSGSATQAHWDDLQLRVPNFPDQFRTRLYTQTSFGDLSEDGDRFGSVVAVGDFNGDGIDDAAFGIPDKDIAGIAATDRGNVIVVFGSPMGLSVSAAQSITPAQATQAQQRAGSALAAGDFNCDGFDDLAVGIPDYDESAIPQRIDAGRVVIFSGSAQGLVSSSETVINRFTGDIAGSPQSDDRFGAALTAGNFNRDSIVSEGSNLYCEDLAIGAPGVDIGSDDTGAVFLLFGSPSGLETSFSDADLRVWHQGRSGIGGAPEDGDTFGAALANFDRSNATGEVFADVLAISSPDDAFSGESGATVLLPGVLNDKLMNPAGSQLLTPSDFSLPGQRFLRFGQALSSGMDYDASDLFPRFAVGAPFSDEPSALPPQTGLVVTYRPFTSEPPVVIEPPDPNTSGRFGQQIVHADTLNRGIPGELWVSEPGHSLTLPSFVSAVGQVFRLGRDVLSATGPFEVIAEQAFLADDLVTIDLDADDEFGALLARGNFNGYGGDELLMGIPGWDIEFGIPRFNVGAVIEVSWDRNPVPPPDPDLLFKDSFEGGLTVTSSTL